MPSKAQLQEVVIGYTSAPDTIETRHLPQIAIMFNLDPKQLQHITLLQETARISVDQAVSILHDLPKRVTNQSSDMRSCLELLFEGAASLDEEAFLALWKKLNLPLDKFQQVKRYALARSNEDKVTVDAICQYFEEDPKNLVAQRKLAQ